MSTASSVKKNKKRRSPAMAAALVGLLIMMVLVLTLAMFTSSDLVTNRFQSGKIDIVLLEPNWNPSNATTVLPGDNIAKDPKVKNVDELDVYVFLKVTVPAVKMQLEATTGNDNGKANYNTDTDQTKRTDIPMYKFVANDANPKTDATVLSFNQSINPQWILINQSSVYDGKCTYVYAYKGDNTADSLKELKPNDVTETLFDSINVNNFNENYTFSSSRNYGINIEAYGIQADYLDVGSNEPANVWAKIQS